MSDSFNFDIDDINNPIEIGKPVRKPDVHEYQIDLEELEADPSNYFHAA